MPSPSNEALPSNRDLVLIRVIAAATDKRFMIGKLNFDEVDGGQTHYTASVRHWTREEYDTHITTGFHEGWGTATDQRDALVKRI